MGDRLEILTTADRGRWAETLEEIGRHDFCHLASCSALAELSGHGQARMFVYREDRYLLAFPVLLREVEMVESRAGRAPWRDVTSVYGYAGPIANLAPVPPETSRRFMGLVRERFAEDRVVSAFSRMHPLLEQASVFDGCGEVVEVGWTLSVDLTRPEEAQVADYRRNHRQDIKHLRAMGVECAEVGPERLDDFVAMYYENMDRVGASRDYYFSRSYFERFLRDMEGVAHLFICQHGGRPIAGGIFTLCRGIGQWYLSGSVGEFEGPPPTKLMFDVARRWAIEQGAQVMHLGGGVGGSRDSLYSFKRGFTQREHVYSAWRCIVNEEMYRELVRRAVREAGVEPDDGFFPRYRHPSLQGRQGRAADGARVGMGHEGD